jgi:predicted acyl esterase
VSAPLDKDLVVTGELAARLYASTSGTDSDFVVKVIDVFPDNAQGPGWKADEGPDPAQYAKSLNGYQLPVAMEVRRGRYLKSFEKPARCSPMSPCSGTFRCATAITSSGKDIGSWFRCNLLGSR